MIPTERVLMKAEDFEAMECIDVGRSGNAHQGRRGPHRGLFSFSTARKE